MTINSIIEQCFEDARAAGLSLDKQNAMAAEVLRRKRPEWADTQIDDTINWVRSYAPSEMADGYPAASKAC
jgi:hypothetical protein